MSNLSEIVGGGFNPNEIEDSPSFENLPDGKYISEVEKADVVTEDDGSVVLKVQYACLQNASGQEVKGKAFERFTMKSDNEKSQKWGRIFWKEFVEAMFGQGQLEAESDLYLGQCLQIELKTKGEYQNVSSRKSVNSQLSAPTPAPATAPAPATTTKPWER